MPAPPNPSPPWTRFERTLSALLVLPVIATGALALYLWVSLFEYADACMVADWSAATFIGGLFVAGMAAAAGGCAIFAVSSVLVAFGAPRLRPRTSLVLLTTLAVVSLVAFSVLAAQQPTSRASSFSNSCDIYE